MQRVRSPLSLSRTGRRHCSSPPSQSAPLLATPAFFMEKWRLVSQEVPSWNLCPAQVSSVFRPGHLSRSSPSDLFKLVVFLPSSSRKPHLILCHCGCCLALSSHLQSDFLSCLEPPSPFPHFSHTSTLLRLLCFLNSSKETTSLSSSTSLLSSICTLDLHETGSLPRSLSPVCLLPLWSLLVSRVPCPPLCGHEAFCPVGPWALSVCIPSTPCGVLPH